MKLSTVSHSDLGVSPFRSSLRSKIGTVSKIVEKSVAETVRKGTLSNAEAVITSVEVWSRENHVQLHPEKCKKLVVDFTRDKQVFEPNHLKQLNCIVE